MRRLSQPPGGSASSLATTSATQGDVVGNRAAAPSSARRAVRGNLTIALMLTLTFTTGMIDAIGFLGLDRVFTGNMTGNVVIIGMALTGADGLPLVGPALALAGFMLGAATGGWVLRSTAATWTPSTVALIAVSGGTSIVAGVVVAWMGPSGVGTLTWSITCALGAAMGVQASAARNLAIADLTTVVVTSTIVGLAADQFSRDKRTRQGRRLGAVTAMLLGACCGAALLLAHIAIALIMTGLVTAIVAGVARWKLTSNEARS